MRKVAIAMLALVLMLPACGGDSSTQPKTPPTPVMTGGWSGTVAGGTFTLTVTEASGSLTGSGSLSAGGGALALTVTGTHAHPSVSMIMHASGYEDLNFSGTMTDASTIIGTLNGSGFNSVSLTLRK